MNDFDNNDSQLPEKPDLKTTLNALQSSEPRMPNASVFYGLSDIETSAVDTVRAVWQKLLPEYRHKVMDTLNGVAEKNIELDYRAMGLIGLEDTNPEVRAAAIELLWEDESLELMYRLLHMTKIDEDSNVRAEAVKALGRFILLGELGKLPTDDATKTQEALIELLEDEAENILVRRRALESIANCSHDIVPSAIRDAYNSHDIELQAGAIFAMGRTCDDDAWTDIVLRELYSDETILRFEATRAAGELELDDAIPALSRLTQDPDREIQEVAIWALGEIGGNEALRILNQLADQAQEVDDEVLSEIIEDAIASASLNDSNLVIYDISTDELDDLD